MSQVSSSTAMIATFHFLRINSFRKSGRLASMNWTMSRATKSAASGTLADVATGIPSASTYFL